MMQRDIKETVSEEKGAYSGTEREPAFQKHWIWTSLLAQRIRICLPVQGMWVQSLVQEDSTCRRAAKPTPRDYCTHAPRACALRKKSPHTATGE